jgi:hypothetical protein
MGDLFDHAPGLAVNLAGGRLGHWQRFVAAGLKIRLSQAFKDGFDPSLLAVVKTITHALFPVYSRFFIIAITILGRKT